MELLLVLLLDFLVFYVHLSPEEGLQIFSSHSLLFLFLLLSDLKFFVSNFPELSELLLLSLLHVLFIDSLINLLLS